MSEWTLKAFLEEHDKKWEAEIARLNSLLVQVEKENEYFREAYNNMVALHNDVVGELEDELARAIEERQSDSTKES